MMRVVGNFLLFAGSSLVYATALTCSMVRRARTSRIKLDGISSRFVAPVQLNLWATASLEPYSFEYNFDLVRLNGGWLEQHRNFPQPDANDEGSLVLSKPA
jgi:hypothetical protein